MVHLLGSAAVHGTAQARMVSALAQTVDPSRYRLAAWFLAAGGPLEDTLRRDGVETRIVPFRSGRDLPGAFRFARALTTERPALVHLHVTGRSRTALIRALSAAKRVEHFHGTHAEDGGKLPLKRLARGADAVLTTSEAVATATGRNATVVYPGVEPPATQPPQPVGTTTIGTAARLEPVKQIGQLLEATARLNARHPSVTVEIAGDGGCRMRLQELARSLKIAGSVRFLGWRQDVQALHRRWRVFAIPSRHEGFGMAALEAMASGLPVVASATGGLPELVEEGRTGFLVPPGDPDALADRLGLLLDDDARRREMGAAARERARRHFAVSHTCRLIEETYDGLLGS